MTNLRILIRRENAVTGHKPCFFRHVHLVCAFGARPRGWLCAYFMCLAPERRNHLKRYSFSAFGRVLYTLTCICGLEIFAPRDVQLLPTVLHPRVRVEVAGRQPRGLVIQHVSGLNPTLHNPRRRISDLFSGVIRLVQLPSDSTYCLFQGDSL